MKLLMDLYKVHSPSGHEEAMRKFIASYIGKHIKEAQVVMDKIGNLFVTKGLSETYPCIVAHMDEVHTVRPKKFKVVVYKDNYILGGNAEILRPCGIGADDKNGIWVALRLLERFDVVKAAFFVGEETGCVGSRACDMKFFDNCRFVLQADRKDGGDFIDEACGVTLCDQKFKSAMKISQFGYKCTSGLSTDVQTLKSRGLNVACANVSCGYYNPHTIDEYTDFSELENCLEMCEYAFRHITDVMRHKHKAKYDLPSYSGSRVYPKDWGLDDETDMNTRGGVGYDWRQYYGKK